MAARNLLRNLLGRLSPAHAESASSVNVLSRLRKLENDIRRRSVYLGDHECLTRLTTGQKIYVDTRDVSIASHLMLDGCWEPWVANVLTPLIKPGMRVCDVGANFGYYTLLMASQVGPEGRAWAIEANPAMTRLLRKSLQVNGLAGHTTLLEMAAWDRKETLEFRVNRTFAGGGSVRSAQPSAGPDVARVKADTLDSVIKGRLDVVKIDVEGAEERALAGMANIIDASPKLSIVMEYTPGAFQDPRAFFARFAAQGFSMRVIHPSGLGAPQDPEGLLAEMGRALCYVLLDRG